MRRISCDTCEKDLTDTGPMPAWGITLGIRPLPHVANIAYSVHVHPPAKPGDFCSIDCLLTHLGVEQ